MSKGVDIYSPVIKVVQEYNFEQRFNCFVSDNAKNNNLDFIYAINNDSRYIILRYNQSV